MTITFSRLGNYGRFGNQLFQIASTIGVAKTNGTDFTFPEWKYQKYFPNALPHFTVSVDDTYIEQAPYYQEIRLDPSLNWSLEGYFQSWKYFNDASIEVKHYLYMDLSVINRVAIHVRRGDYIKLQHIHPVLSLLYYKEAMKYFPRDTEYVVFSDDIEWCKTNFIGDQYSFMEGTTEMEDFTHMRKCKGFIIANSSFSWWAAYLAYGYPTVVAPINYVANENSYMDRLRPEWIKI